MDSISEIKERLDLDQVLQSSQLSLKRVRQANGKVAAHFTQIDLLVSSCLRPKGFTTALAVGRRDL